MKIWKEIDKFKLAVAGLLILLIFGFLSASIFVPIGPGESGVLWRRFGGGTVVAPQGFPIAEAEFHSRLDFDSERNPEKSSNNLVVTDVDYPFSEGLHLKFPWDEIYIYDIRMQEHEVAYEALTRYGSVVKVNISIRWRPIKADLGKLHKDIGPDYLKSLIAPLVGTFVRYEFSKYSPNEFDAEQRLNIQKQILQRAKKEMKTSFYPADFRESLVLFEDISIREIVLPEQ